MEAAHGVVLGFDVGRYSHHMTAVDARTGEVAADGPVGQDEPGIREALGPYAGRDAIVVVDQPGGLSSLLFAVARDLGIEVGFITPRAMARGIDLYGGEAKTDGRDSFVIADLSLRIPSLVHGVPPRRGDAEELAALMSYDRELTDDARRAAARLHELLLATCPALDGVFAGQRVKAKLSLAMLARYGGANGLASAGRGRVRRWAKSQPRCGERGLSLVDELIRIEAASLGAALVARERIGRRVDELLRRSAWWAPGRTRTSVLPCTGATMPMRRACAPRLRAWMRCSQSSPRWRPR